MKQARFFPGGIILLLIGLLAQAATASEFSAPIGLQLESVSGGMHNNMNATLDKVHRWGFSKVELVGDYGLSPEALKSELASHQLTATSAHFPYAKFRDDPEQLAIEAQALGLTLIGCPSLPQKDKLNEEGVQEAIKVFNHAGEVMAAHGLKFFYHPHGYEFKPSGDGTFFDMLVKGTNPKFVHFQMDIYWIVHAGQDPLKLFERYPDRWVSMHLKDMRRGAVTGVYNGQIKRGDFVPIGQGKIRIVDAMGKARELGIASFFIEDESSAPDAGIPQSLHYLKAVHW